MSGFVCTLLHVSIVASCQGLSALNCMLVMVVLPLVRICLHSIAGYMLSFTSHRFLALSTNGTLIFSYSNLDVAAFLMSAFAPAGVGYLLTPQSISNIN